MPGIELVKSLMNVSSYIFDLVCLIFLSIVRVLADLVYIPLFQVSCSNNQVNLLKMPNMEVMRSIAGIKVCNMEICSLFLPIIYALK